MIILKNVSKSFRDITVLNNINLNIKDGEFVSLVGPSGCGKSTIINLISGLLKPSNGEILINGKKVTKPGIDRIMVFQEAALFPWLNVFDNVAFGLRKIIKSKSEIEDKVNEMLKKVHLLKFKNHFPHELSGGMKQRVAIARSLVMNPEVLLMDEPFSALDEQTRMLLHAELQDIWMETGKTIIFVTHNIRESVVLSDRVIVMGISPGRIIDEIEIRLSRPRSQTDPDILYKEEQILKLLENEIEKLAKEELGDDYTIKTACFSHDNINTMGGGI